MKNTISEIINSVFKLFKVQNNKIMFECGRGMVDGSPKAIYDYIKENCSKKYKLIWIVNKDADTSLLDKKDFCFNRTLKSYYVRATAKYWIKSESIGSILKKKKGQIYIQAWHGHGALKKMGNDVTGQKNAKPMEHIKEWDYLLTNDPIDEKMMLTSTGYKEKCLMIGTPLTDYVIKNSQNKEFKKNLREKIGIYNNKSIILYAPTFRDEDLNEKVIDLNIEKLNDLKDYNVILRLHPLIRNKVPKDFWESNQNFINGCKYPNVTDLLCITDLLISDYSSIIYEFSVLEKPIIFYAYDLEKYEKSRGFYIKYPEELPGPVAYTEKELYQLVLNSKNKKTENIEKIRKFNQKYNYLNDGNVCKKFLELLEKGYFK